VVQAVMEQLIEAAEAAEAVTPAEDQVVVV
jgi:hypothetical protein